MTDYTDYTKYGFKRSDITEILGSDFFTQTTEEKSITVNMQNTKENNDKVRQDTTVNQPSVEWEPRFKGRKHALEIISALSFKLAEKSGNAYHRGDKISANAIGEMVASMLNKPDNQQYRKLISQAINETQLADDDNS